MMLLVSSDPNISFVCDGGREVAFTRGVNNVYVLYILYLF